RLPDRGGRRSAGQGGPDLRRGLHHRLLRLDRGDGKDLRRAPRPRHPGRQRTGLEAVKAAVTSPPHFPSATGLPESRASISPARTSREVSPTWTARTTPLASTRATNGIASTP